MFYISFQLQMFRYLNHDIAAFFGNVAICPKCELPSFCQFVNSSVLIHHNYYSNTFFFAHGIFRKSLLIQSSHIFKFLLLFTSLIIDNDGVKNMKQNA